MLKKIKNKSYKVKHRIHVNRHNVASNRRHGTRLPVFTAKSYKENRTGTLVKIMHDGEEVARFVYSPDKPLSCGAVAWVETDQEVVVEA